MAALVILQPAKAWFAHSPSLERLDKREFAGGLDEGATLVRHDVCERPGVPDIAPHPALRRAGTIERIGRPVERRGFASAAHAQTPSSRSRELAFPIANAEN